MQNFYIMYNNAGESNIFMLLELGRPIYPTMYENGERWEKNEIFFLEVRKWRKWFSKAGGRPWEELQKEISRKRIKEWKRKKKEISWKWGKMEHQREGWEKNETFLESEKTEGEGEERIHKLILGYFLTWG